MKLFLCFIEYEPEEFECPSCGVELCMKGNNLKEIYEPEPEPEEKPQSVEKKEVTRVRPKGRKRRTG